MSRKRTEKKEKRAEMARQMGVSTRDAAAAHHLQERERVTRPELRLVELSQPKGLKALLGGGAKHVVAALFVIESKGARLLDAVELTSKRVQLDKVSYTRPSHFVLVVALARSAQSATDALRKADQMRIDGLAVDDAKLAQAWEQPREAELTGVGELGRAAVVSVRGVDRTTSELTFKLGRHSARIELSV